MATKGKQEKVEQIPGENPPGETPELEPQTISMTQEEMDAKIVEAAEKGKGEAFKEYQGIQKTIARKDQELESLREQLSQPKTSNKAYKALLEAMEAGQDTLGEPNPKLAMAKQIIVDEEAREAQAGIYRQQETFANQERGKLVNKITEANLDPSDEMFDAVWDKWEYGRDMSGPKGFEVATQRLDRILKNAKPEKKEEDEEEANRKKLEEEGILHSPASQPSAASSNDLKVIDDYAAGKVPRDKYVQAMKNLGLEI